jgi:hypothetical protein
MKRMANSGIGLMLVLGLAGIMAFAQTSSSSQSASSGQSLGDYARQIRKEPDTKSKAKVFDNDNLPKTDKLSVVGTPEAPPATEAKSGEAANATSEEAKPNVEAKTVEANAAAAGGAKPVDEAEAKQVAIKQWSDKLAAQKQQIDLLGRELNVLQREYQVRAAAMYADAGNRLRNQTDWDKQDTQYKQQIADKQKAVDEAKQKLTDLQEEARKAGVPASVREE